MAAKGRPRTPVRERFLEKCPDRPEGECWQWRAGKFSSGYGAISIPRGDGSNQNRPAHLIAYELFIGPVPVGLQLDHRCHTEDKDCSGGSGCPHRGCVNPWHLEPVTRRENLRRGRSNGARSQDTGMCAKGLHSMENAYEHRGKTKGKQCRECNLQYGMAYRAAKKAAKK